MPQYLLLFGFGLMASVLTISFGIIFSVYFNIADHPGDHKQHQTSTPFVGGIGVISALLIVLMMVNDHQILSGSTVSAIAIGASMIFVTGLADDIWRLDYKVRFLVQGATACLMVYEGGVMLISLGQILPGMNVDLGSLALLFTLFATLGVINALNMIDGIDGLSGSVSLVSLVLLAVVSMVSGQDSYLILIIALIAGVVGFLGFNLRCYGRHRAVVFLGDNGSMLLGFLFSWLFIGLSQGPAPAMTPVTALWLFAIPLIDTVTVMIRRVWLGKSPFYPDRHHLHHLLLRAGFRTNDVVCVIVLLHGLFGAIGLMGLYLGIAESLMLIGFLSTFAGYLYVTFRPWRFVPGLRRLHRWLGLTSADCQGVFIGYFSLKVYNQLLHTLQDERILNSDYTIRVYEIILPNAVESLYAVLEFDLAEESRSEKELRELVNRLKKRFGTEHNLEIRQYMRRNPVNDRRISQRNQCQDQRQSDRRNAYDRRLYEDSYFLNQSVVSRSRLMDEKNRCWATFLQRK